MFRSWAYPGGIAAPALLMLRLHAALFAVAQSTLLRPCPGWTIIPLALIVLPLLAGLFTRTVAALVTTVSLGLAAALGGTTGAVLAIGALASAALILLGAGAWSLDARLFGRRMILLRRAR
ncbi:MAG: hypothetical protein JWN66_3058 [Sphingomonas bacterium]|uniref:hypothetical protein n=1 Tax=Sphingomonas bacterium TaxID=1895847 RepID=UPI002619DC05|nr:hypothetical protein [Sphingomonas bacterium]MDB5705942.1 hypothetical protein [Sphingomonas bacterium]